MVQNVGQLSLMGKDHLQDPTVRRGYIEMYHIIYFHSVDPYRIKKFK